jgi:hypothetical protein
MTIVNADIGVIQKRREAGFSAPRTIAAADAFAMRIARSYLPSELTISRAELALAYGASDQINNSHTTRVEISPSISLHDHFSLAAAPRETAAVRQPTPGVSDAQAAALFERLFSRHKRVAAFPDSALPGRAPSRDPIGQQPVDFRDVTIERVERTLPRPAGRGQSVTSSDQKLQTAVAETRWGSPLTPPAATPKPFTLPPGEVKRVTDEVIREIDHRIIARRERMGRR